MLTVSIDRVHARYRVPTATRSERVRLQHVLDDALTRVLEGALERVGVGPDVHVCVRDAHAVASLRLREPDSLLVGHVGDAIAKAIQRLIDEGSPSVVRYGSRVHALVDLASSAIAGDFSRSWAWVQMGLWRSDGPVREGIAAELILRALAMEPVHAVAVAACLARMQPQRWQALMVGADSWPVLARAVIGAARSDDWRAARAFSGRTGAASGMDTPAPAASIASAARAVERVAQQSNIARASRGRLATVSDDTCHAVALLALLEVEPAAAWTGRALADLVPAVARALGRGAIHPTPVAEGANSADGQGSDSTRRGVLAHDDDRRPVARRPRPSPSDAHVSRRVPAPADVTTDVAEDVAEDASDADASALPDVRQVASTECGGLLYLVNLVTRTSLLEMLAGDARWAGRGVRWVLHQLAMALAGTEPADPATLAFAGLQPEASAPSVEQGPPDDAERAELAAQAAALVRALRDALAGVGASAPESDRALLDYVCRRPATLAGDPGWIEARFSLEDVSLDIRRAGLDRDPGWVSGLGIVLRFVYA